jgi:2-oxoglutarate ferredoxin oxidoreductase subunit beta
MGGWLEELSLGTITGNPTRERLPMSTTIDLPVATQEPEERFHFRGDIEPVWCPGCGDFALLNAIRIALRESPQIQRDNTIIVSGIGCSGRVAAYLGVYGFHGVHGRALPTALGVKEANPNLNVIVMGGDGDGFSIGGGHIPHAARRNPRMTYIIFDNEIYGLTKGQVSPTSPQGLAGKSTPEAPAVEEPLNPIALLIAYNTSFVARVYAGSPKMTTEVVKQALAHPGFAVIQAMSPCTTFYNTYKIWSKQVRQLPDDYDPTDRFEAFRKALDTSTMWLGIFYRNERPTYEELLGKRVQQYQAEGLTDRQRLEQLIDSFI